VQRERDNRGNKEKETEIERNRAKDRHAYGQTDHAWTNFSQQDETWAEFSTLEGAVCMPCSYITMIQNCLAKNRKLGQTTSSLPLVLAKLINLSIFLILG
jgi:hypothetical protein